MRKQYKPTSNVKYTRNSGDEIVNVNVTVDEVIVKRFLLRHSVRSRMTSITFNAVIALILRFFSSNSIDFHADYISG